MPNVLFICGKNRLRSPTAEHIFADGYGVTTSSAGVNHDADQPVGTELLAWADLIFVMQGSHRRKLSSKFQSQLRDKRIVCLDIPDEFDFMDDELVRILKRKVTPFLPASNPASP